MGVVVSIVVAVCAVACGCAALAVLLDRALARRGYRTEPTGRDRGRS